MSDDLDATLKRMDELQIAFVAKLDEKADEFSRLNLLLDPTLSPQDKNNNQVLLQINQLAHVLSGSAGTFKQTSVYTKAKAIETLSSELLISTADLNWYESLNELISILGIDVQISGDLPITETFSGSAYENELSNDISQKEFIDFKNCKVILVDDDELLVTLIKEQAKHFEYNIIPLLSTEDLDVAIDKHQPMAILMDVVFPNDTSSGIDIIKQLKEQDKIHCPVVFMSDRCDTEVRIDALRAGSDGFIVKPIDILELIRVLDRITHKFSKEKSRVLIVDDDAFITNLYQLTLEKEGFVCACILDAMEIINKILSFEPHAILLDINMPLCNGFEIAQIIRQDDQFTHIPILFLTSTNTSQRQIQAIKSGGDEFLDKNVNFFTLIEIIKGHVYRYRDLDTMLSHLKRNEIRFRSVTSSSSDAIITTDAKNRIIFWNEGAENILGYHSIEAIGQPFEFVFDTEKKGMNYRNFLAIANKESGQLSKRSIETVAIRKDKTTVDIELTFTEWLSGNEAFYTAIIRDITERKLIINELFKAKELAETANKAKSRFLSNMSHELRTPLNAILGFSQLMQMDYEEIHHSPSNDINEILKAGDHLLHLINDVLDLTKVEAGAISLSLEPVDVKKIIEECFKLTITLAEKNDISFNTQSDSFCNCNDTFVIADRVRLKQVLLNLITNAVKYNTENGVVTVTCQELEQDSKIRITVKDTGKGLDIQQQKKLFIAFERLGAEQLGIDGTGIGLVLSRQLIEEMKGCISFKSQIGVGSQFWIELPKANSDVKLIEQKVGERVFSSLQRFKKILYIEDNHSNLFVMEKVFKSRFPQWQLITAKEAMSGLTMANEQQPDLILLDINLPVMDGFAVYEQLKCVEVTRHIPVIAVSALAMDTDLEKSKRAGFADYIIKPIDIDILTQSINKVFLEY